jgi:hypothetical protein
VPRGLDAQYALRLHDVVGLSAPAVHAQRAHDRRQVVPLYPKRVPAPRGDKAQVPKSHRWRAIPPDEYRHDLGLKKRHTLHHLLRAAPGLLRGLVLMHADVSNRCIREGVRCRVQDGLQRWHCGALSMAG